MGKLRRTNGPGTWTLCERSLVGRSRVCSVRLEDPTVSGEHALLRWNGRAWEVQDLRSRNGTFVAGLRLQGSEPTTLSAGTTLGFGVPDGFVLVDAGAPAPFAVPLAGGPTIEGQDGLLALPDSQTPELTVHRSTHGWSIEQAGAAHAIEDGDIVHTSSGAWRLHLPGELSPTEDTSLDRPRIDTIALRFCVSRDEETVVLHVLHRGAVIDLKNRVFHYPLLLLARARLRDVSLPPTQQGWVEQGDLIRQLRVDDDRLYSDIFRNRRQLANAGIDGAARLIERRQGSGLLRIGVTALEIVPLGLQHHR